MTNDLRTPVTVGVFEDLLVQDQEVFNWNPASWVQDGMLITPGPMTLTGVPNAYAGELDIVTSGHTTDVSFKGLAHPEGHLSGDYAQTNGAILLSSDGTNHHHIEWVGWGDIEFRSFTLAIITFSWVHLFESEHTVIEGPRLTLTVVIPEAGQYAIRSFIAWTATDETVVTSDYTYSGAATFTDVRHSDDADESTVIDWLLMDAASSGTLTLTVGKSGAGALTVLAGTQMTVHMVGLGVGVTQPILATRPGKKNVYFS